MAGDMKAMFWGAGREETHGVCEMKPFLVMMQLHGPGEIVCCGYPWPLHEMHLGKLQSPKPVGKIHIFMASRSFGEDCSDLAMLSVRGGRCHEDAQSGLPALVQGKGSCRIHKALVEWVVCAWNR